MLKFKRGKRRDSGEWIVGFYMEVKHHDDDSHVHAFILLPGKCVDNVEYLDFMVEVIPESVGDDTGRENCNGIRIYEGDILQYYDDEIQVIEWWPEFSRLMLHTYGFYEVKRGRKLVKEFHSGWNDLEDYPLNEMPIIGNVFDNPELIRKWRGEE